jgi:glycosyltransferase involved in cell wall biosynthesis
MHVSVIIPALNEAESIGFVVREMPWHLIDECIVVDNGSTDDTAAIAAAAGARVIKAPRGYGAACMDGAAAALPTSDVLVFLDGDGADIPAHMPELLSPIERGEQDLVLGTRLGPRPTSLKPAKGSMLASQIFAGWLVGTLLRMRFPGKHHYTDMCAFRAIRRTSLDSLAMRERTYGWNLEMQIRALQRGVRVTEIPVGYRTRYGGISKVSGDFQASLKAARRILEVLFRVTAEKR